MKNIKIKKTGALKEVKHGLVDYIAEGFIIRNDKEIPCQIGYLESYDSFGDQWIEPTHIFIQDGILEDGTCYNAETIEL